MEADVFSLDPHIFFSIVDSAQEAVIINNAEGCTSYVNKAFVKLFGASLKEVKQLGYAFFFPEESLQIYLSEIYRSLQSGRKWRGELKAFNADKELMYLWALFVPILDEEGKIQFSFAFMHNMSDRKRIEDALHQSENRYQMLFEYMTSGVAIFESIEEGRNFIFRDINQAGQWLDGVSRERVIGRRLTEVFPSTKENGVLETLRRVWRFEEPVHFPLSVYEDGKNFGWRENWIYKLPSGEVVVLYDDIHDWKRVREKLQQSEMRNRAILDAIPDMIFRYSRDGRTVDFKPGKNIEPFVPPENFIGKNLTDVLPEDVAALIMNTIQRVLDRNELETVEYSLSLEGGRHDYEGRMIASGKDEVVFIVRDITQNEC